MSRAQEAAHELVLNARQHAGYDATSETTVATFFDGVRCGVRIEVKDDGPGIAATLRPQLREVRREVGRRLAHQLLELDDDGLVAWLFRSVDLWGRGYGLGRRCLLDEVQKHPRNALVVRSGTSRIVVTGRPGHETEVMRCAPEPGVFVSLCLTVTVTPEK